MFLAFLTLKDKTNSNYKLIEIDKKSQVKKDTMDQVQQESAIPMPKAPFPEALQTQIMALATDWFEYKEAN